MKYIEKLVLLLIQQKIILEILYEVKAFKNYKQYKYLLGLVIEIGKINNGLLNKKIEEIK